MYSPEYRQRTPITEGQLSILNQQKYQADREIYENNQEIRLLNGKIHKNDYDHSLLDKLYTKEASLQDKRREFEQICRNHQHMQSEINQKKIKQSAYKHTLGNEYLVIVEEKKRKAQEERRREIDQEKQMHEYNRKIIEDQYYRKKQLIESQKRSTQEELAMREEIRQREKYNKQKDKDDFNKKVQIRQQIETQKDSVYKQYYNHFSVNQDKLHHIYNSNAAVVDQQRQMKRNQFQRKQIDDYQQKITKEYKQKVIRMSNEKDMLRSFLQSQIQQKNRKQSTDRADELYYHRQVARYQQNNRQSQYIEKQKKKDEQRRYDEELKEQTRQQYHMSGYGNSTQAMRQSHNPITNPIDFKIGITNPYLIKQYENTKEKYMGDSHLKLRNLAVAGSNSLFSS